MLEHLTSSASPKLLLGENDCTVPIKTIRVVTEPAVYFERWKHGQNHRSVSSPKAGRAIPWQGDQEEPDLSFLGNL